MFPRESMPEQIGQYKIVRHLSSRSGADLYLGQQLGPLGFSRSCVLKLVPSPAIGDPRLAQELAHEAAVCSKLSHSAIVRMYDFFEHGDRLVLVFEHFAGLSLARFAAQMRRRKVQIPDPLVWYIANSLFGAVAHAHALCDDTGRSTPVIHRDIQPAHIIISSDAQVRLAGFGIAKIAGTFGDTAAGFIKGTPAYMAPEQARGEKITERVDVYAAALVVWELLSGRTVAPPGSIDSHTELLKIISGRSVETVESLRPDIPREIAAALDACLETAPDKRNIKASEVERWLKRVVNTGAGRDELRERLVQLRQPSLRPPPPATTGRVSIPPKPGLDPRKAPARFPGLATRATGRVSAANAAPSSPPSSRKIPALRSRSAPAGSESAQASDFPKPVPAAGMAPRQAVHTILGLAPPRLPSGTLSFEGSAPVTPQPSDQLESKAPADELTIDDIEEEEGSPAMKFSREELFPSSPNAVPASVVSIPEPNAHADRTDAIEPRLRFETLGGDTTIMSRRQLQETSRRRLIVLAVSASIAIVIGTLAVFHFRHKTTEPALVPSALLSTQATVNPPLDIPAQVASAPVIMPSAKPSDSQTKPPVALASLPQGMGILSVKSPPFGVVFVSGMQVGETDSDALAPCGRRYVRVGTHPGSKGLASVSWLSKGQSVVIPCGGRADVDATSAASIPDTLLKDGKAGRFLNRTAPF